ncbi:hypothetical protein AB0K00_51805 [Dactylosporangium sp. NPDC049525]|uniref:hypothetical protein n=1 Tax=Dactylosporangium sp. NPDC049525 TaxID=3154730 RepID=UPI00344AD23E
MMTIDDLRERAQALRNRGRATDAALVGEIEAEVQELHALHGSGVGMSPELAERLSLLGWLLYEASWQVVQRIEPGFEILADAFGEESQAAFELATRLAEAARVMPWPEHAPRALGALRAQALAESKRDTEDGYDRAWEVHEEVRLNHGILREVVTTPEAQLALDEILLQLALAETGTACRTAERVISRWGEGVESGEFRPTDDVRWSQRMFRELSDGMRYGGEALAAAARISDRHGFADAVDEHRLALPTAFRNPGIMTARAALLVLALTAEMEGLGRSPQHGQRSWPELRDDLVRRFEEAYRAVERPVIGPDGREVPLSYIYVRSLVQLRLTAAVLVPGHSLPSATVAEPCLAIDPLDDTAVEAMSSWLTESVDGRQRGDANVIGSATMPSFIRSVEACRAAYGTVGGYREWRKRWPTLDRYDAERDRRARVKAVL